LDSEKDKGINFTNYRARAVMKTDEKNYQNLHSISKKARILSGISSLLEWDSETFMPTGAFNIRAQQLETMAGIIHKEQTSTSFRNALSKLVDIESGEFATGDLTISQQAAVREWRSDYIKATKLPSKFVTEFAAATAMAVQVWTEARKKNAFQRFAPYLERIVNLSKEKAEYLGYDENAYSALIDLHEPGMTRKKVSELFGEVKKPILSLLKEISSKKQVDNSFLHGKFPQDKQLAFGQELLESMGFDMTNGRLDLSTHPFSSSCHPSDSRITTRIHQSSLMSNILAVLHEGGHSLYEMNLPKEAYGSPLCEPISFGIHESQSRWWETLIGQSEPFWKFFLPKLQSSFKGKLDNVNLNDFYKGINLVEPSFIRVEADEVTYTLHVILRFELECELIDGSLNVKDLPEAWNAKMKEYLNIEPKTYSEGCLQDIHWATGAFGYFPTYTLGNLYAAHFFTAFETSFPNWQEKVASGHLNFIKEWLNQEIHRYGREYSALNLAKKVTGRNFSAKAYIDYLQSKYKGIYSL
jgi:carboxypeptidase Taq